MVSHCLPIRDLFAEIKEVVDRLYEEQFLIFLKNEKITYIFAFPVAYCFIFIMSLSFVVKERLSMFFYDDGRDQVGHGQKMADIITLINPDVKILSIKALNDSGVGNISDVYAAIQVAIEKKVKVINLSISALKTQDSMIIEEAIKEAIAQGIVVVGAAGNNGIDATLTFVLLTNSEYLIGQVGDSRAYFYEDGLVRCITIDQTVAEYERESGLTVYGIDEDRNLKIIDMGSACYKGEDDKPLGTPGYASPEHYICKTDERSDVYSMGMSIYHLLTGIDPTKKSFRYIPVRKVDETVSSGLDKIVDKALSENPENRYKTLRVMADALYSYEKLDDEYISGLKKKIFRMIALYSLGGIFLLTSLGLIGGGIKAERTTFEHLIYSETNDLDSRVEELVAASNLRPKDPAPYIEMIRVYSRDGLFTEPELASVSSVYQQHKEQLKKDEKAFAEVSYEIGESILTYYTGETDNSNRAKLMAALPYFENAVYEKFDKEPLASGYAFMGSYYKNYVLADTSLVLKAASEEEYLNLLEESKEIIEKISVYKGDPQGKMRLITYDIALNLIDNQRNGFAKNGIPKEAVTELISLIQDKASQIGVEDSVISEMKEDLSKSIEDISKKIDVSYEKEAKQGG